MRSPPTFAVRCGGGAGPRPVPRPAPAAPGAPPPLTPRGPATVPAYYRVKERDWLACWGLIGGPATVPAYYWVKTE